MSEIKRYDSVGAMKTDIIGHYVAFTDYESKHQAHLQTKKELEELQDAIREWDERPTGLRRACIRTAIEASKQRNNPKEI